MAAIDRRFGVYSGTAFKVPCRVATTANITLSGLQTIDGVALAAGDRVLVKNQTDQKQNGIWVADTGGWERAVDFNGSHDVTKGTLVLVTDGATYAGAVFQLTTSSPLIGTSNIVFAVVTNMALRFVDNTILSPMDFGAVGDGIADDTTGLQSAINAAAAAGMKLSGGGRTFLTSGNLVLPAAGDVWLEGFRLKRKANTHAANTRILRGSDLRRVVLIDVKIDRNGTPDDSQTYADAAGIYLSGPVGTRTLEVYMRDVEVTGDGPGMGIVVTNFDTVNLVRPWVHDMAWYNPTDPGSGGERLQGLLFVRGRSVTLINPVVERLRGWWNGSPLKCQQSDGLGVSDVAMTTVLGGRFEQLNESFDSSGTFQSRNVWFIGTRFVDVNVAWKATHVSAGGMRSCDIIRPGLAAVWEGSGANKRCENHLFSDLYIEDCGANHEYGAPRAVGLTGSLVGIWKDHYYRDVDIYAHTAIADCSISGTTLTVSSLASGMVAKGQNVAGTGVTAGTWIVGKGLNAAINASVSGTTMTVNTVHYGAVVIGQTVDGPGIPRGTTVLSGSGPTWTLSASASFSNRALLLEKYVDENTFTVNQSQSVSTTTMTFTSNMIYGVQIDAGLENEVRLERLRIRGANTAPTSIATNMVVQQADKSTAVTMNRRVGKIEMHPAALAGGNSVQFTLNNDKIAASDIVRVHAYDNGTLPAYTVAASVGAGFANIYVRNNTAGSLSEALRLRFEVIRNYD